jgi:Ca2+-binding EF-hand superfamily protein
MKKILGMELKTENVFNALENIDEDGDKLISKEEIISFCTKNPDALEVLGVSSVDELCAALVCLQNVSHAVVDFW